MDDLGELIQNSMAERLENSRRLTHNITAETHDLLAYENQEFISLVSAVDRFFQLIEKGGVSLK